MTLSTHVLDALSGRPAAGIDLHLYDATGTELATGRTDPDGRHRFLTNPTPGIHRLVFATGPWFESRGVDTFYPEVVVTFTSTPGHVHVPLLLSPYSYTTYRGS